LRKRCHRRGVIEGDSGHKKVCGGGQLEKVVFLDKEVKVVSDEGAKTKLI